MALLLLRPATRLITLFDGPPTHSFVYPDQNCPSSPQLPRSRSKDDKFTPDSKIVLYAKSRKLPFVTDASYVNANPVELPVGEKSYQKITRGHLASNVEMKSLGDPEEGLQAQKDSFKHSVINKCRC